MNKLTVIVPSPDTATLVGWMHPPRNTSSAIEAPSRVISRGFVVFTAYVWPPTLVVSVFVTVPGDIVRAYVPQPSVVWTPVQSWSVAVN